MTKLPKLHTDITLSSPDRTIVIDTKYYREALDERHGKMMIRPNHLNQIYVYVRNLMICEQKAPNQVEGILLYPTIHEPIDLEYSISDHQIRVVTLDLSRDWHEIDQQLHNILRHDKSCSA